MPSADSLKRRLAPASALLVTFIALAAQLVGGLLPSVPLFAAAAAVGLALELAISYRRPGLLSTLSRAGITVTVRQLLRDTLLLLLLLRVMGDDVLLGGGSPIVVGLLLVYLAHSACQTVAVRVRRSRVLPIVTRNIDPSALRLSAAPPAILVRRADQQLLGISVLATAGLLATAVTRDTTWGILGLAAAIALATAGATYLSSWLTGRKRAPREKAVLEWLAAWLAAYRPTVGMYFSGGQASAYQANMWLSTLAELDGRPVIVLRERYMVQQIEATDIPIVCIPKLSNLMTLEDSTLKVLLHPANAGKTSQALRIPSIKQTFINHGESDKLSSCNPYAKAYDEVWVAGPAARERYALADVGVEDKDIVEVGRPQLAPILPYAGAPEGDWTTVLYAPTWEGWTDASGSTSLILAGENIVRELLADPRVRLIYKPHPFTGDVEPRAGRANERVMAMITEANAARAAEWGGERPDAAAQQLLRRRTEELDMLLAATFRTSADELERMMLQGTPGAGHAAAVEQAVVAWEDAYWAALPPWEHQIITAGRPSLYCIFNASHLLISDVSSVVSDYLTSAKPYAVANTSGLSEQAFRDGFPTVRAATILTPDASGVAALLRSVREPDRDRHAAARAELKEYLLGPSEPTSLERFNTATLGLAASADARRLRAAGQQVQVPGSGRQTRPKETPHDESPHKETTQAARR